MSRIALTLLDSKSWVEVHDDGTEPGLIRAEFHRPLRGPSVGWVDRPACAESDDAEAAVLTVLAGTGHDARAAVARLGVR